MTNQNQVVNVNVKNTPDNKRKKRRKNKPRNPPAKRRYEPERGLQASAYNTTSAPNRPYVAMTSFIASPYNNGLVPELWRVKDIQQETLFSIKKAEQQQLAWNRDLHAMRQEVQ